MPKLLAKFAGVGCAALIIMAIHAVFWAGVVVAAAWVLKTMGVLP